MFGVPAKVHVIPAEVPAESLMMIFPFVSTTKLKPFPSLEVWSKNPQASEYPKVL